MSKETLIADLEKAKKQLSVAKEPDEIQFAQNKIDKLQKQIDEYVEESVEPEPKPEPKPKKVKKAKKTKKGKGVRALIPDRPIQPIDENDPDCAELLKKHRETAKKRRKSAKKRENTPLDDQVVNTVEKAADSVETKVEKIEDQDETLDADAVKKLKALSDNMVKNIAEAIKSDKQRKQFIQGLMDELKKLL